VRDLILVFLISWLVIFVHVQAHVDYLLQFDHYRQQCQAETRHWQYEVNEVVLIERVHKDSAPTVGLLTQYVKVNFDILHRVNRLPNP